MCVRVCVCRCKRFRELVARSKVVVLARASPRCLSVRAKAWSDEAHRFLQRCADAGNLEACYLLGMVRTGRTENRLWRLDAS
jgi:hypothetical protein